MQMADDDKLEPNDDPWAGLEAEGFPDLNEGFSFSFDEQPATPGEAAAEDVGEGFEAFEESVAEPPRGEELIAEAAFAEEPVAEEGLFEPPVGAEEEMIASESLSLPEGLAELLSGSTADEAEPAIADSSEFAAEATPDDAATSDDDAVGDWLGEPEADPSALGLSVFSSDDDDSNQPSGFDPAADLSGEHSTVQIGTGTSGIASPSSIEAFGSDAEAADDDDPFAALGAAEEPEGEPFDFAAADEASGEAETGAAAGAASAPPTPKRKVAKQPPRKKKSGMVGQLLGVIGGGLMSIPIVLGILWWGVGKDPLEVAPMVPDSLSFLLPAKLRAGGPLAAVARGAKLPSLDDVLGADSGAGDLPAAEDLAMNDPEPEPDLPADDPLEPLDPPLTDLAAADPLPAPGDDDDPLMALLNEESPAPVAPSPPPVPEPEPLDTAGLEAAADQALAALAAVKAVEDLNDPVGRKLLVGCYRSLAAYAQELAMLERVAADTGRPLAELPAAAEAVPASIAERPELFEPLARLTRDWLAFKRRPSDGALAPATFVAARQVGPYWRTEVAVGEKPLVVLSRSEPSAVPGETVLVTGLVIDEGVLWASEVRPAKRSDPFGL
jgi:hypothetical protein